MRCWTQNKNNKKNGKQKGWKKQKHLLLLLCCFSAMYVCISPRYQRKLLSQKPKQNQTKRNDKLLKVPQSQRKVQFLFSILIRTAYAYVYMYKYVHMCAIYAPPKYYCQCYFSVFFFLASAAVPNHKSHNSWARGKASWSLGPPAYPYISEFYRIYLVHTYVLAHLILVPWVRPMTPTNFDRTLVYRGVAFATSSFCPFRIHYVGTRFLFQKKKIGQTSLPIIWLRLTNEPLARTDRLV